MTGWHVYAVLAQQDRHWMEAAKSYRNALKADDVRFSCVAWDVGREGHPPPTPEWTLP